MSTYSYEDLETAIGNLLRKMDNYDMAEHHFFPISFLDRLTHFAENISVVESRSNPDIKPVDTGSTFDVWVDNMAAKCKVLLQTENNRTITVPLIEIYDMDFTPEGEVYARTGETSRFRVLGQDGKPLAASSPEDLHIKISTQYERGETLEDLEGLASLFIRAGRAMKVEINNANRPLFEEKIFNHFKFDLIPMIPYIQDNLETILDEDLVTLTLV